LMNGFEPSREGSDLWTSHPLAFHHLFNGALPALPYARTHLKLHFSSGWALIQHGVFDCIRLSPWS